MYPYRLHTDCCSRSNVVTKSRLQAKAKAKAAEEAERPAEPRGETPADVVVAVPDEIPAAEVRQLRHHFGTISHAFPGSMPPLYTPRAVFYLVPGPTRCRLGLGIRCCDGVVTNLGHQAAEVAEAAAAEAAAAADEAKAEAELAAVPLPGEGEAVAVEAIAPDVISAADADADANADAAAAAAAAADAVADIKAADGGVAEEKAPTWEKEGGEESQDAGDTAVGEVDPGRNRRPVPGIACPVIDLEDAVHAAFHAMRYAVPCCDCDCVCAVSMLCCDCVCAVLCGAVLCCAVLC